MDFKTEHKERIKSLELLKSYLDNPGRFSILILGERGTGKKHWIKEWCKENGNQPLVSANASFIEEDIKAWSKVFQKTHKGVLVIEDVEKLSLKNQSLLFEGMSTGEKGRFGFDKKEFEVRVVFTSAKDISLLRDTENLLSHKFFDRISQLVVKMPNSRNTKSHLRKDFKVTWDKFEFQTPYPELLDKWISDTQTSLFGNFRDLDKLCINWNNYQLMGTFKEEEILEKIEEDFRLYYHFPERKEENVCEIVFDRDISYPQALDTFRTKFKAWAKEEFGSLRAAGETVGISGRSMERW